MNDRELKQYRLTRIHLNKLASSSDAIDDCSGDRPGGIEYPELVVDGDKRLVEDALGRVSQTEWYKRQERRYEFLMKKRYPGYEPEKWKRHQNSK